MGLVNVLGKWLSFSNHWYTGIVWYDFCTALLMFVFERNVATVPMYFPMIFTIWLTLRWKIITRTTLLFCIYVCKHRNPTVLLLCCGAKNTNTKLNKDHLQSLGYMCASARSCVCLLCQCAMNVWQQLYH